MLNGNELARRQRKQYMGDEAIYRRGSSTGGDRGDGKKQGKEKTCSFRDVFQKLTKFRNLITKKALPLMNLLFFVNDLTILHF